MVFQPHRYTRTRDLYEDFVEVLKDADKLILLEVYAAGEPPITGADGRSLCRSLRQRNCEPVYASESDAVPEMVASLVRSGRCGFEPGGRRHRERGGSDSPALDGAGGGGDAMSLSQDGTVAVLLGGSSAERDISLQSGQAVLAALRESGVAAAPLDPAEESLSTCLSPEEHACAFIVLHGPGGEDGTVQGALELLGLPYTGSGIAASALAGDKLRSKWAWQGMGLPTPPFIPLTPDSDWEAVSDRLGQIIVKPVRGGSSLGMSRAEDADALEEAFHAARSTTARCWRSNG